MLVIYFILTFTIINIENDHEWETGTITARTCEIARQHVENGLRSNQRIIFGDCVRVSE